MGLLAAAAMILAARLPSPRTVYSAPGLVPFLTGLSLLLMAIGLGVAAVRRGALQDLPRRLVGGGRGDAEARRTLSLIALVLGWVLLLDLASFELRYRVADVTLRFGSFECVSIPMLAWILRAFWRASLTRCALVSVGVILALAVVFQYGFKTLLPGAG